MTRRAQGPQPAGFVGINWANPNTRGLVAAYTNGVDHVTGRPRPITNPVNGQNLAVNANGVRSFEATEGGTQHVQLGEVIGGTGPLTYICRGYKTGDNTTQGILMGYGDRATLLLGGVPGGVHFRFYHYNGTNWNDSDVNGATSSTGTFSIAGRYDGVQGSAHGYGPGQSTYQVTTGAVAARASPGTYGVTLGEDTNDTGRSQNAFIDVALVYNIALTNAQIKSLVDDPWQVFRSLRLAAVPSEEQLQLFGTLGNFDAELRAACWF